jgi:hypothetical protein
MPNYVEEREFTLRFELRCAFPDDYAGELDGFAWAEEFRAIAGELVAAAAQVVARHPGWCVRGGNRGRSSEEEITLVAERAC